MTPIIAADGTRKLVRNNSEEAKQYLKQVEIQSQLASTLTCRVLSAIGWLVSRILKTGWIVVCSCVSASAGLVVQHYRLVRIIFREIGRVWK